MSRSRKGRHRENARKHARKRAWQRFGLALALPDIRDAEARIWAGYAEWLADLSDMRQAYRVSLKGRNAIVIFDIHIDAIVTCLPDTPLVKLDGKRIAA